MDWQNRSQSSSGGLGEELGPIRQTVTNRNYNHIVLLSNYKKEEEKEFIDWLKTITSSAIFKFHLDLTSPTEYEEIYRAAVDVTNDVKKKLGGGEIGATYHLSPGTPAMAAAWILLSKTSHPAEIINSAIEQGVRTVSFPFDISADYILGILKPEDDEVLRLTQGLPPESPESSSIIHRSKEIKRVVAQAPKLVGHDVQVIIQSALVREKGYLPGRFKIILSDKPENLIDNDIIKRAYLSI